MVLKVKRLREGAVLPQRATDGSAGYDLYACLEQASNIPPGERVTIPIGLAVQLPEPGCVGLVFGRSGMGVKHGIMPSNAVGVVDSDYRGEIMVGLYNSSAKAYIVNPGDRIAQLVIVPVLTPQVVEADALGETGRGTDGFGSTGR